ncbi:MAG: minichromosome maintenance protein MCM, partial [Gammaproteobacteria bacterium]|nr:minichromosome maintenance protein MCM [Gammaproteobacteria bacterium]
MNSDTTLTHLQTFYTRYHTDQLDHLADVYPDTCSFTIDYNNLERFDPDIAELLESDPDRFLKCAHEALKDMELGVNKTFCCNIRIENYYRKIGINDIRSHHIGAFFTIEGIVAQITPVMPRMTEAAFDCQRCGTTTMEVQTVDKLSYPLECCNETCTGKGLYKIDYDESTIKDFQMIRLQELPETLKGGEQPH